MALSKVLVVDDEPDIRMLVSIALKKLGGLDVRTEPSGPAALDALSTGNYQPDMILLDVMMPDMDGVQTLAAIRSLPTQQETPICFFTAKVMPDELDRLRHLGVCRVLSKPFSPATLITQIKEAWQSCQTT